MSINARGRLPLVETSRVKTCWRGTREERHKLQLTVRINNYWTRTRRSLGTRKSGQAVKSTRNAAQRSSQLMSSSVALKNSKWRRASRITEPYRPWAAVNTVSSRHLLIAREREHMWHMSARARGHRAWLLQRGTRSYFSWHGSCSQNPWAPVTHANKEPYSGSTRV